MHHIKLIMVNLKSNPINTLSIIIEEAINVILYFVLIYKMIRALTPQSVTNAPGWGLRSRYANFLIGFLFIGHGANI